MTMMLVLWLLTLTLLAFCLLFWRGYYVAPATLFCLGFFACFSVALVYQEQWGFELHDITLFVVMGGLFSFTLAAIAADLFFQKASEKALPRREKPFFLPVYRISLAVFLVINILAIVTAAVSLMQMYPGQGLLGSMGAYNNALKFESGESKSFPRYVLTLRNITLFFGYVACYLLAQQIVCKRKKGRVLLVAIVGTTLIASMQSGARSGAVGYIVVFFACYELIMLHRYGRRHVSIKQILTVVAVCLILVAVFQASLTLLGRQGGNLSFLDYLTIYCGAQLPNLDEFLIEGVKRQGLPWGAMTFVTSYGDIGNWFGVSGLDYSLDLPFRSRMGQSMGNVYTAFYSYYYDFGFMGVAILSFLAGFASQVLFRLTIRASGRLTSSVLSIFYAILSYNLVLSFFTNRLYESFFATGILRYALYIGACLLFYFLIGKRDASQSA